MLIRKIFIMRYGYRPKRTVGAGCKLELECAGLMKRYNAFTAIPFRTR